MSERIDGLRRALRHLVQGLGWAVVAWAVFMRWGPGSAERMARAGGPGAADHVGPWFAALAAAGLLAYLVYIIGERRRNRPPRPRTLAEVHDAMVAASAPRPAPPDQVPKSAPDCAACHGDVPPQPVASHLHALVQDESAPGWIALLALIAEAERSGATVLAPGRSIPAEQWAQVVTLPPAIGRLERLEELELYGSSIAWLPPEIGDLEALRVFTPYTSRRLHWFPYELTRCTRLRRSTISTRNLYGNGKHRPPFPDLRLEPFRLPASPGSCSICRRAETDGPFAQYWLSLRVATDVVPLLARCCSAECLARLPRGADGYLAHAHQGGMDLAQPPR